MLVQVVAKVTSRHQWFIAHLGGGEAVMAVSLSVYACECHPKTIFDMQHGTCIELHVTCIEVACDLY